MRCWYISNLNSESPSLGRDAHDGFTASPVISARRHRYLAHKRQQTQHQGMLDSFGFEISLQGLKARQMVEAICREPPVIHDARHEEV